MTRVAVDAGPTATAFEEEAYLAPCRARKLVDYDLSTYTGLRTGNAAFVSARLGYEDGERRITFQVEDGTVLALFKKITLSPQSAPMLDPRIDGVPVAREQESGCPVVCRVQIHDVYVFGGPHTLSVAGGRWTEPMTLPVAADATTVEVEPVLTAVARETATRLTQQWKPQCFPGDGCVSSPCVVDGEPTPPKSMTVVSGARPQKKGVFGPPYALNVELAARADCSTGPADVNMVVTLPHDGEPSARVSP